MTGRILVVDDIATNRVILRAKLAAAYYDVSLAECGTEAIEKTQETLPDLILLDIMMPDMNGFEVCKILKADPKTAHIPVIMVTALNETGDRMRGLECGADDFLSKPIDDLALLSRVRNLLRAKFMFDELRLRDQTTQELGLGIKGDTSSDLVTPPGRAMLVPSDAEMGRDWHYLLTGKSDISFSLMHADQDLTELHAEAIPDVFVVHARLGAHGDGLRLVSHLRSQPRTRHAGVVLVVPQGDQATAAKGLDLGASDHIFDPFDPNEMIVRLNSQIRRKKISDRLRDNVTDTMKLAVLDPLTGLYNRRYAKQHIEKITEKSRETGKGFALMVLDIDRFKQVNDTFGHAQGDAILKEFSDRIQENLRGIDLVSRIGGEEFLIAMPDTSKDQASVASERLRRIIEETPFDCASKPQGLNITVSIGVSLGDPGEKDVETLISQADKALYVSKADGRNIVTLFNSAA